MLARWLWVGGCCVVMGSVLAAVGCSSSENDSPASAADNDAGVDSGVTTKPTEPKDGGDVAETKKDAGPPPTVDITYGTCPAFSACGGDVKGSWVVSGGCLPSDTFAAVKQGDCDGLKESDVVIKASGTLEATETTLSRNTTIDLSAKVAIPQKCVESLGAPSCLYVEAGLTAGAGGLPAFDKVKCTNAVAPADGCDCVVEAKISDNAENEYTVSGKSLKTDDARTFDYCVKGTKTSVKETTKDGLPVVVELTAQ